MTIKMLSRHTPSYKRYRHGRNSLFADSNVYNSFFLPIRVSLQSFVSYPVIKAETDKQ